MPAVDLVYLDPPFSSNRDGFGRSAARERINEAVALAASALALADEGERYDLRTMSRLVFADLLQDAGRVEEAAAHAQELIDLARYRGDVVFEGRARDILERIASGPTPR